MDRGNDNLIMKERLCVQIKQKEKFIIYFLSAEEMFPDFRKAGPQYI